MRKVPIEYRNEAGRASERVVRPLALSFYPPRWILVSWCGLRSGFRNFRLDRVERCEPTSDSFTSEPGRSPADYVRQVEEQMAAWQAGHASP
jgi:predicted DNA-binding transcriptional regulator YafY